MNWCAPNATRARPISRPPPLPGLGRGATRKWTLFSRSTKTRYHSFSLFLPPIPAPIPSLVVAHRDKSSSSFTANERMRAIMNTAVASIAIPHISLISGQEEAHSQSHLHRGVVGVLVADEEGALGRATVGVQALVVEDARVDLEYIMRYVFSYRSFSLSTYLHVLLRDRPVEADRDHLRRVGQLGLRRRRKRIASTRRERRATRVPRGTSTTIRGCSSRGRRAKAFAFLLPQERLADTDRRTRTATPRSTRSTPALFCAVTKHETFFLIPARKMYHASAVFITLIPTSRWV